ncbi:MAG: hypothetical protein JWO06_843, partial [Bacteroidota bacterium]|nr:hypothetical protein [Bacteroidota bacterium]
MKAQTNNNAYRHLAKLLNSALPLQQMEQHEPEEQPKLKIAPKALQKFEALLLLEKIKKPDLDILTPPEKELFYKYLTQLATEKKDIHWDIFVEKIEDIVSPDVNDDIRESNRQKISNAIAASLKHKGKMPGKAEIARTTGLSRSTVQKHLKEFAATDDFKEYLYAKTNVMESVIKAAVNGDMRAAKLYVGTVTKLPGTETNTTVINQQNNYIQLNGKIQYLQDLPE